MVQSVAAVPVAGKMKREHQNVSRFAGRNQNSSGSFSKVLEKTEEEIRNVSLDCHTTTYGRDSKIRIFVYQPVEYRY